MATNKTDKSEGGEPKVKKTLSPSRTATTETRVAKEPDAKATEAAAAQALENAFEAQRDLDTARAAAARANLEVRTAENRASQINVPGARVMTPHEFSQASAAEAKVKGDKGEAKTEGKSSRKMRSSKK